MNRPLILCGLLGLLLGLRLSAATDLLQGDQEKQIGYVMDILHHGHWLVQYEVNGQVATKPPLYNWCAALLCWLFQSHSPWVIKLPSLLAGIVWLATIYALARRFFDDLTASYAAMACIASHHFSKLIWFARTDMLMAATLSSAIWCLVTWPATWKKSVTLGLLLAACALSKGPIGPVLYALFWAWWSYREETLFVRTGWWRVWPGGLLFVGLVGGWLLAVWHAPNFYDTVIRWQLGTRMAEAENFKPVYYYLGHLVTRVAQWTVVAAVGVWLGRSREEWPNIRFVLGWGLLFLALLSLIPVKRHDHLLPVYPPFFLLAGYGVKRLIEPVLAPQALWLLYPVTAGLVAMPLLLPWAHEPVACLAIAGAFACGLLTAWCYVHKLRLALPAAAAGLVFAQGVYHHGLYDEGRASYETLRQFADYVRRQAARPAELVLFQAHPLLSYELDRHVCLENPQQLAAHRAEWLVMPDYYADMIRQEIHWELEPCGTLTLEPRQERATLFRVLRRPPPEVAHGPAAGLRQ